MAVSFGTISVQDLELTKFCFNGMVTFVQPTDRGLVEFCNLLQVEAGQMQQWLCYRKEILQLSGFQSKTFSNVVFYHLRR